MVVRVFDEYDKPLEGIIAQDACFYLFECLVGRIGSPGVWAFTHIGSDELAQLDAAEGTDYARLVQTLRTSRPGKLAVLLEGEGIVAEADAWQMTGPGLQEASAVLMNEFRQYVDRIVQSRFDLDEIESTGAWERAVAAS